jgi:small subunit ribosomal protein S3
MIEKKFVKMKKDEFALKEFIKEELGKGKISSVTIERTPVGEKIAIRTSKPGLVIGRRGEKIAELTSTLKKQFSMENPHIEIAEIKNPNLDAWSVAEEVALTLERFGPMGFKTAAYKMLERIKKAGGLGAEIRLSGKLPSERARSWAFRFGLLKKAGDAAKVVDRAKIAAETIPGVIGIKVEILTPEANIVDRLEVNKNMISEQKQEPSQEETGIEAMQKAGEDEEKMKEAQKKRGRKPKQKNLAE